MNFQNFSVTPLGNAQLIINESGNLVVTNIGNSGLDGVMIDVRGHDTYKIFFNEIPMVLQGGVFQITTFGINDNNQTIPISEKIVWFDTASNYVQFGHNLLFLPPQFILFGELNGSRVFEIQKDNPIYKPSFQAVWGAITAIATLVIAAVGVYQTLKKTHKKSKTTITMPNGTKIEHIVEITDPQPFEIIVNNQTYLVDNFGVEYQYDYPENNGGKIFRDSAVQITGYNLGNIEIIGIS